MTYCSQACADDHWDVPLPAAEEPEKADEALREGRRGLRWVGAALVAAGAALASLGMIWPGHRGEAEPSGQAPAAAQEGSSRADNPAAGERGDAPPSSFVAERTEALLREAMEEGLPSQVPLAAAALSRVGDERALAVLREHLEGEKEPLARVELARALARAGDERGERALENLLSHDEAVVVTRAGNALAELGAEPPREPLRALLDDPEHGVAAASALARLGDREGTRVLRELRRRSASSPEERSRAAVSLGLAGDESVRDALLERSGQEASQGAAVGAALAALGEEAAIPGLEAALASPAHRVTAAESLRRLGAEVSIEPLVRSLLSERGAARIAAAEAIFVLEGAD